LKILVLNSGSSSLKYQLIDMKSEEVLTKGMVEKIGLQGSRLIQKSNLKGKNEIEKDMKNHKDALKIVMETLIDEKKGVIKSLKEIQAVGHRVVHGGEKFSKSILISDDVINEIEKCEELAPLHNPANKMGIQAIKELLHGINQVAVFDTAYHQTMEPNKYLYAIPYGLYEKYRIRKYGFHGTSHKYVAEKTSEFLNKKIDKMKIITCHIGNGVSITAIAGGKVVDTSMGFTPLEGLVMGTRSGDLDPSIVSFIMKKENMNLEMINNMLNKESGIYGLSGISSDLREVEEAALAGDKRAILALEVYVNRIVKYIGAYVAELNGLDVIVFTAGVGENSNTIRKMVVDQLNWLGIKLNEENNKVRGEARVISTDDSVIKVLIMPTDEEYMIAKDTYSLVSKLQ